MPVLDVVLKSSVLLLLAAFAAGLGRRSAASQRHFIWLLVMSGLLALPVLTALVPWRLPVIPAVAIASARPNAPSASLRPGSGYLPVVKSSQREPASTSAHPSPSTLSLSDPGSPPAGPRFQIPNLATIVQFIWLAGLTFVVLRLLLAGIALARMMSVAREMTDAGWQDALDSATAQLGIRTPVRLLVSPRTRIPLTFGVRKPVIVLPADAYDWPAELRDVVLLHELAHVRRADVFANLVCQIACAVYWFHPLVWGAARRLRIEAERACDDLVLRAGAPPSAYASHLLSMVQSITPVRAHALAVPLAQRSAFEGRVLAILEPGLARQELNARAIALGVVALLAVAVPLAALEGRAGGRDGRDGQDGQHEVQISSAPDLPPRQVESPAAAASSEEKPRSEAESIVQTVQTVSTVQTVPSAVSALALALADADESVRLAAANALGSLESADTMAINALLAALRRDTSREVRKTAAWALGEIEDARAVPGLVAALRDERDDEVRKQIAWALGEIESEEAVDGLGAALRGEDNIEIRRMIVWALGEIESAEAVPYVTPLLRDADMEMRKQAAWALGEIESPNAVDAIAAALQSERVVMVREMLVWALGEIEDRRGAPALEQALRDTSLGVRRKAVWALGEIDNLGGAPAGLIAALRDSDVEVRRGAAHALAELEDAASVPALVQAIQDEDLDVKREAVRALGEIRGAAAVEALVTAMRDPNPEIRRLAAAALGNK